MPLALVAPVESPWLMPAGEPWSVDDPDMKLGQDCDIVRDTDGRALARTLVR